MPHGDADLALMKANIGDSVCLMGGLNPTMTLERGTPAEVRREILSAIEGCANGGGFILSTAGSIWEPTQQAYDNVMTVIKTSHEAASN